MEWQVFAAQTEEEASSRHKAPAQKQVTLAAASVIPHDQKGPRWQRSKMR